MDTLFWWTGAAVWAWAAGLLLVLCYYAGRASCVAVDWMRWSFAVARAHRQPIPWRRVPVVFGRRVLDFMQSTTASTWYSERGRWEGFRRWVVYPPTTDA